MTLDHIALMVGAGVLYALIVPARWRGWVLLVASIGAVYWLQPALNVRWMDYALPTLTLVIALVGWAATRPRQVAITGEDRLVVLLVVAVALLIAATRTVNVPFALTSRPPPFDVVLVGAVIAGALVLAVARLPQSRASAGLLTALIGLFIVIKTDPFITAVSAFIRERVGQAPELASPLDLGWLGFSYVAFRLIHTIRDRQSGKLPALSLRQYLTFIIFFPALTAGPIDRAERHLRDDEALADMRRYDADRFAEAGGRIASGLFKKFIIADSLAAFSLSAVTVEQATTTGGMWLLLYAYTLRLFFDFSGYTDIAIGIGLLFGFKLPENFNRPYLKPNLTAFWQSWHITLSNWVRFYVFMPLTRALLRRRWPNQAVILCGTLATMLIIGLWHGVTWPFFIWGLWHGVGLFAHKVWTDRTRGWYRDLRGRPRLAQLWHGVGVAITFHFVALGWVWFALPRTDQAIGAFALLFGIAS
ncbi:MAG: MBOAT family protein [Anaerolineaceae bacterium]|nr:MAG: MBOAT family protein [Anaerolineaceae bacterium]